MAKTICLNFQRLAVISAITILTSLAFGLSACQTMEPNKNSAKTQEILDSQKAIVHNALDSGDVKLAYQSLRRLLMEFPEDASIHNLMGLTQLSMKNAGRAVKHFQTAYKLDGNPGSALNLSSALIESGDYEKAVTLIKAAMNGSNSKPYQFKERFLHNLAYANLKLKKNSQAETIFKSALEENPAFYPSHLELARLHKTMGRPALAIRSYREAMDYCHVCLDPVSELTSLYVKTGKVREARNILIKFNKIQGVADQDRKKATSLLNIVTAAGTPKNRNM